MKTDLADVRHDLTTLDPDQLRTIVGGAEPTKPEPQLEPRSLVKGTRSPDGRGTEIEWRNRDNERLSPLRGVLPTPDAGGYRKGNGTKGRGGWAVA
jgi:hypothetical protein